MIEYILSNPFVLVVTSLLTFGLFILTTYDYKK